jgi:hypothetical protein
MCKQALLGSSNDSTIQVPTIEDGPGALAAHALVPVDPDEEVPPDDESGTPGDPEGGAPPLLAAPEAPLAGPPVSTGATAPPHPAARTRSRSGATRGEEKRMVRPSQGAFHLANSRNFDARGAAP